MHEMREYIYERALKRLQAKDITCKNCNYKGHFAKLCKSRNKRPTVNTVSDNYVNTENCTYTPPENSWMEEKESCDVINAWNEYGQSDNDDFSVLSVRTIYDNNDLETKKLLNLGIGYDCKYEHTCRFIKPCKFFKTERTTRN